LRGDVSLVDPQFGQVTRTVQVGGTAFGSPNGSVALDANSAWVVFGDSTLARLDAEGEVVGKTLAGSQPAAVVSADGSVWVTNSGDATVQRFSTQTFGQGPLRTFNVGRQPRGIVRAEGAIWVAISGDGVVTRIDPNSGSTVDISVEGGASAVASADGAIWVANTSAGTISRIDPATYDVVATIETGNAPAGLATANGLLWVAVQSP
jgi:YVTN family beta-propeller protein